jgi:hypothetical protein
MHFLLIPYALLSFLFLTQFVGRRESHARGSLLLLSGSAALLLFISMWWRPATGDSWRYLEYFRELRSMSLGEALGYRKGDSLYVVLNWVAGGFGDSEKILFGATLLVYFSVFVLAVHRLVGRLGTLVVVMCYVAFPYFVAYGASGLRQGLALVFLLMGYVALYLRRKDAWIWVLMAPFWHSGAWLAMAVVLFHQGMCRLVHSERLRWTLVLGVLLGAVALSISGLNDTLVSIVPSIVSLDTAQEIYFSDAREIGYQAGFRLDFFAFSMLPLLTAILLRRRARTFDYRRSGWWLSIYLSLTVIYHLFSFAPFADRFAAFSWFLLPLVIFMQVLDTRSSRLLTVFVALVCAVNVVVLQMYTGNFIAVPEAW